MKRRKSWKVTGKRILSSLLIVAMSLPSTSGTLFASEKKLTVAHYDPELVTQLQEVCDDGEKAVDVLDNLRAKGIVDETGALVDGGTFKVNGKTMTEQELAKEAKEHTTGEVNIDGEKLTWKDVNETIELKESLKEFQEFKGQEVEIDENLSKEYLKSAESLKEQLANGQVKVYSDPTNSSYGAGISHQSRLRITPDRTQISDTGNNQVITVTASLVLQQNVPVSFSYRTLSGSAKAEGSGTITFQPGETEKKFEINYYASKTERNGQSKFYIICDQVKNALIENGKSATKNYTIPITVTQYKYFTTEHSVNASIDLVENNEPRKEAKSKKWYQFWKKREYKTVYKYITDIICSVSYENIEQYLKQWSNNEYTFIHRSYPTFDISGVEVSDEGTREYEYGKYDVNEDTVWCFITTCVKDKEKFTYKSGVSGELKIKEIHEKISLVSLTIPDGTFYTGEIIPITATFDEKVNRSDEFKLKLSDGTVLVPDESGYRTQTDSLTFLYKVPENPSGTLPSITELSIGEGTSFSDDRLIIPGQSESNRCFNLANLSNDNPDKIKRTNNKCLMRAYKDASFESIHCQIDEDTDGILWVTEVINLNGGNYLNWIKSNCQSVEKLDYKTRRDLRDKKELEKILDVTQYKNTSADKLYEISQYVKSMYLSVDGGVTKIPFYVITKNGNTTETNEVPVALVANFKAEINTETEPKQVATEIFLDQDYASVTDYMQSDKQAELLLSITEKGLQAPQFYSIKSSVMAYPGIATIDYSKKSPFLSDWTSLVDNKEDLTTYHLKYEDGDFDNITTNKRKNPEYVNSEGKTYKSTDKSNTLTLRNASNDGKDAEIKTKLFDMQNAFSTKPFRMETDKLSITAKFNQTPSFYGKKNLIWVSSDEKIAKVEYPHEYDGNNAQYYGSNGLAPIDIVPQGRVGSVYFTLYALNEGIDKYTPVEVCRSVNLVCEPGEKPFLRIPSSGNEMAKLSGTAKNSLDVCFITNVTEQNAEEMKMLPNSSQNKVPEYATEFVIEVYEADYKGEPIGGPIYSTNELSTVQNPLNKMTIPKDILTRVSTQTEVVYAVKILANSLRVRGQGATVETTSETLMATAGIVVYPDPPSVSLKQLDNYSILDNSELSISYELKTNGSTLYATGLSVTDSEGNTVLSRALVAGEHSVLWKPNKVEGKLKENYVVKACLQAKAGETPTIDSYLVSVYDSNALDILVDSVDGKSISGINNKNEYTYDNHDKIKSLISKDGKTIQLGGSNISLQELSSDTNLSSMISINYGDYVWGQITDQIKWDVKAVQEQDNQTTQNTAKTSETEVDEVQEYTATTLNYKESGAYSDIKTCSYISYAPSENFMAVGLANGKTAITATHASTGMKSSIEITSKTLRNQLFLFKCLPAMKTKVTYTNGNKEKCEIYTDDNGELALYEESGIISDVNLFSETEDDTYVGTIIRRNLMSGEQDLSKLQYYPINNYKLCSISKVKLYIQDEKGNPYKNKSLWIRSGIYKNDEYCYAAFMGDDKTSLQDGKEEHVYQTDDTGAITVYADSTQFFTMKEETLQERTLRDDDVITYIFEVKFQPDSEVKKGNTSYEPQFVHISATLNSNSFISDCSTTVNIRPTNADKLEPVINSQYLIQYNDEGLIGDVDEIHDYKGAIGLSVKYPKVQVKTETLMWGESVDKESLQYTDKDGISVSYGTIAKKQDEKKYRTDYLTNYGMVFLSQTGRTVTYEFADMPVVQSSWEIKKEELDSCIADGKVVPVLLGVYKEENMMQQLSCSFQCSNNSKEDIISENSQSKLQDFLDNLCDSIDFTGLLSSAVTRDKMYKWGGQLLSALTYKKGMPLKMELKPTKDPRVFHLTLMLEPNWEDVDREEEFYDEDGNIVDTYTDKHYGTNLEKDMTYEDKGHSDKDYALKHGFTKNGGKFKVDYRDESKTNSWYKRLVNKSINKYKEYAMDRKRDAAQDEARRMWSKKFGKAEITFGGAIYFEVRKNDFADWTIVPYGGGLKAGVGAKYEQAYNFMIGPVPATCTLAIGAKAELGIQMLSTGNFEGIEPKTNYLYDTKLSASFDVFCGVGWDWGFAAIKVGAFGTLSGSHSMKRGKGYKVNYKEKLLEKVDMKGTSTLLTGEVGMRFTVKVLFFDETYVLCSYYHEFANKTDTEYLKLEDWWSECKNGVHTEEQNNYAAPQMCSVQSFASEARTYLENTERKWLGGANKALKVDGTSSVQLMQSNAYTYAEPVYNDDGSIVAYLSDSNSKELENTLACYAVKKDGKYENMNGIDPITYTTDELNNETGAAGADGKLDPVFDNKGKVINPYRTTLRTGYGDSTVKIAGTKDFSVAAWVRQKNELPKVKDGQASYEDLAAALNQSEVCGAIWTGTKWTGFTLTKNSLANISPVVAANDKKAIVAWRTCVSSDTSNPTNFDVRDIINAKIYDKETNKWGETLTLYNGQTGSVHALEVAMMEDGTSIASYIVKTGEQPEVTTDAEIMYTMVKSNGNVGESIRVTNDNDLDQNVQVTKVNWNGEEHFILGWLNNRESNELDNDGKNIMIRDVRLLAIDSEGRPSSDFVESIHAAGAEMNGSIFKFSKPAKNAELEDLSIVWVNENITQETEETTEMESSNNEKTYSISAIHFVEDDGKILLSAPVEVIKLDSGETIDEFSAYGDHESLQAVFESTSHRVNLNDPSSYEVVQVPVTGENGLTKEVNEVYVAVGRTNLYTVQSLYKVCAVETEEPAVDREQVIRGFSVPVEFTLRNTGTAQINSVTINLDSQKTNCNVSMLPGETKSVMAYYNVPMDRIKDVNYSIVAKSSQGSSKQLECRGVIKLNLPDVMVSGAEIITEEDKARTIQVTLDNRGNVPFKNGGKEIVLGLFDVNPMDGDAKPFDSISITDGNSLELVDNHAYTYQFNISEEKLAQLIRDNFTDEQRKESKNEIPNGGLTLYAKAWILDEDGNVQEEDYSGDNMTVIEIESLIDKYQSEYSISSVIEREEQKVNGVISIKNNSYVNKQSGNVSAVLCNKDGQVISELKETYDASKKDKGLVTVMQEQSKEITFSFTEGDILSGYQLEDAASIQVNYGELNLKDTLAQVVNISVKGQDIDSSLFEPVKDPKNWGVLCSVQNEVVENGQSKLKNVCLNTKTYEMKQKLNQTQLKSVISVLPKNINDQVHIAVNDETLCKGTGTKISAASLKYDTNEISVTVESEPIKGMWVLREAEFTDDAGEVYTDLVEEMYDFDKNGNPIDEDGKEIDLSADEIWDYDEAYYSNRSIYNIKLELDTSNFTRENGNKLVDNILVAKNTGLLNLKATTTSKTRSKYNYQLTFNQVPEADGYYIRGKVNDTSRIDLVAGVIKKLPQNDQTSYTYDHASNLQYGSYLIEAYKELNGEEVIIATETLEAPKKKTAFRDADSYRVNTSTVSEDGKIILPSAQPIKVGA